MRWWIVKHKKLEGRYVSRASNGDLFTSNAPLTCKDRMSAVHLKSQMADREDWQVVEVELIENDK